MKKNNLFLLSALCVTSLLFASGNCATLSTAESDFLGTWGMDVDGGGVAWLRVHDSNGYLDGELLWIGGSVLPVSHMYLANDNTLVVTRSNQVVHNKGDEDKERTHTRTWVLRITKTGEDISGTMVGPDWGENGEEVKHFHGFRMPALPPAPNLTTVKYGKPITLFNGKDLTGWEPIDSNKANGFKAENGSLKNDPAQPTDGKHIYYGNLKTTREFEDFNLKLEVNVPKGNNSGIYLRGLYEIQVIDSYGADADSHNMGALYSRITPVETVEKQAGEWQTLDITLVDRHVTVILNGTKIIDNQPAHGPTGGAISSDVFAPGPIYLQGDHGNVAYRNIVLTPVL